MAKTLLFVHGTGVRDAGYSDSVRIIKQQLAAHAPMLGLAECRWGDKVGARLHFNGASIPTYGESRGVAVSAEQKVGVMWNLLLQDPGFELGLLAVGSAPKARPPTVAQQVKTLLDNFHALPRSDALKAELATLALDRYLPEVVAAVERSDGFKAAGISPQAALSPHRLALARAVVAGLQKGALASGGPTLDGAARDALVDTIAVLLGDASRGVMATLTAPLVGLAASIGTWQLRRKRTSLTDAAFPVAGDILVYQARGDAIRDFIRAEIGKLPNDDVFVFAHSLGGVACFELLVKETPANVKGLITFGSQAPFFHEIGALGSLGVDDALPAHFPPWLNFYDLADPLSYVGEAIFKGRVSDERVESGESFPASHSAYLRSRELWLRLAAWVKVIHA